jgi:hypothetical protein
LRELALASVSSSRWGQVCNLGCTSRCVRDALVIGNCFLFAANVP